MNDPSTAKSKTGHVVGHMEAARLSGHQSCKSSAKSKCVGLSESLCVGIVMTTLQFEMKAFGIKLPGVTSKVFCRLFEESCVRLSLLRLTVKEQMFCWLPKIWRKEVHLPLLQC
jgi:hypothetical protein